MSRLEDTQSKIVEGQRKDTTSHTPSYLDPHDPSRGALEEPVSAGVVDVLGVELDSKGIATTNEANTVNGAEQEQGQIPIRPRGLLLGLGRKSATGSAHVGDYDKKYPEDAHSQEFGPHSRVYKVYLDEATKRDAEAIDSWRDSLDVLLIFAGLFSAVVSTFVVQVSSKLEPDYAEISAYLQFENNALLRAIADHAPSSTVQVSERSPYGNFVPARRDSWVNGLWYLSLIISLSTAMITMLIKQWLKHHASFIPGSSQDRARVTEARRRAAHFWRLTAIVGILPLLMHASVFVFFAGLALLLSSQNTIIAGVILAVICLTALFYAVTTLLPLFFPHCCYVTPLTLTLYAAWCSTRNLWDAIIAFGEHVVRQHSNKQIAKPAKFKHSHSPVATFKHRLRKVFKWQPISRAERITALQDVDLADVHILEWLHSSASLNPSVPPIICEAISGVREGFTQLSAIRSFSGCIIEDWEAEMRQLMAGEQFSRVERFFRMNAVLYTTSTNFQTLRLYPDWTQAIISVAFHDQSMLRQLYEVQMSCCDIKLDRIAKTDHSYWVHTLLFLFTMGIKDTDYADAPLVRLHPGAWINMFAHIIEFARAQKATYISERTRECVRKHVNILLPAVLSHHYQSTEDRSPYFKEERIEKEKSKKRRVVDPVTILDLPPGHSRMRFLQFLYVYSTPTPEHEFSLYVDFPSFSGNTIELWHKALLLHLKPYEAGAIPVGAVGVLRELVGVLQTPSCKEQRTDLADSRSWIAKFNILQRQSSALEQELGRMVGDSQQNLKEELVEATLDVLVTPPAVPPDPTLLGIGPQFSSSALLSSGILESHLASGAEASQIRASGIGLESQPNPIIGVQLVSLIEALRRINLTSSRRSPSPARSLISILNISTVSLNPLRRVPTGLLNTINTSGPDPDVSSLGGSLEKDASSVHTSPSRHIRLDEAGTTLLANIIHVILNTDVHQFPLSPRLGSITQLSMTTKKLCPSDVALAELSRSLENGSRIFILSDGIDLIFKDLDLPEGLGSSMRRAQSLLAIFRAAQIVSSFIKGVMKMESLGDSAGRDYLSVPETLNRCCQIMVWSEFALYTLNAEGVKDGRSYSLLSKLRFTNRSYLDKWWRNILDLTEMHPEYFLNAWKHVFELGAILPQRPGVSSTHLNVQSSVVPPPDPSTFARIQGQESELVARVALYKKRHYLWAEDIKKALGIDEEKLPQFQLYLFMKKEEFERLSPFTRWRLGYDLGPSEEDWLKVDFDAVKDEVGENLSAIEETTKSELGNVLIPILRATMRHRSLQNLTRAGTEVDQDVV